MQRHDYLTTSPLGTGLKNVFFFIVHRALVYSTSARAAHETMCQPAFSIFVFQCSKFKYNREWFYSPANKSTNVFIRYPSRMCRFP